MLEFINVLEDVPKVTRLSLTKIGLWVTSLTNVAMFFWGADWQLQAGAAIMNMASMVKAEVRRINKR